MIQTKIPVLEIVKPLPLTTETLLHLALKDRSVKPLEISVWEEEPQRLLNNATIVVFLKAAFPAIVIVITIAVTARYVMRLDSALKTLPASKGATTCECNCSTGNEHPAEDLDAIPRSRVNKTLQTTGRSRSTFQETSKTLMT